MALYPDGKGTKVKAVNSNVFPKNIELFLMDCQMIPGTTSRVYSACTRADIKGKAEGLKCAWFMERELKNVKDEHYWEAKKV